MGNSRNTGYLGNVIKVSDTGNISFVSGSTVLMSVSSSGAVSSSATTVSSSVDNLVVNNNAVLGSSESSTVSIPAFIASDLYPVADTYKLGSPANYWTRAYVQTGSFNEVNVTGRITAQTLVVQTITSSVDFVTGSTRFGSLLANTHVFSGSVTMNPSGLFVSSSGLVGIGTTNPRAILDVSAGEDTPVVRLIRTTFAGYGSQLHFSTTGSNRFAIGLNPNDDLYFDRDTTGNGGWNPTTLVIQRSTGNIGIGTSSPSYALDIYSNQATYTSRFYQPLSSNSAYNAVVWSGAHSPIVGYVTTGGSSAGNASLQSTFGVGTQNAYPVVIVTNDTERLRIDSSGNITWINTTTPLNLKPENTPATAITSLSSASSTYNQKPGVYWLNYGGQVFLGYVRFNWHQGRNWVLALKCHNTHDMTSGNPLWQNNTLINQSDFNLNSGRMAKYPAWNHFAFTRLLYEMGNKIPPIMQWNSSKTSLYSVFSSITPSNGSGVGCDSTDPQISTTESTTYYGMATFLGGAFPSAYGGAEVNINFYGLGSFANTSNNSTSATNTGVSSGFGLTTEHLGAYSSLQSLGRSGAWIGCPLDEGAHVFNAASSPGADSGFGLGVAGGNNARTTTSGIISWALGNNVANFLPAYVWLSID